MNVSVWMLWLLLLMVVGCLCMVCYLQYQISRSRAIIRSWVESVVNDVEYQLIGQIRTLLTNLPTAIRESGKDKERYQREYDRVASNFTHAMVDYARAKCSLDTVAAEGKLDTRALMLALANVNGWKASFFSYHAALIQLGTEISFSNEST